MRAVLRAAVSLAMALWLAGPAASGPVSGEAAQASADGAPAMPGLPSGPLQAAPAEAALTASPKATSSGSADATTSSSQEAAEIMREAQAHGDAAAGELAQPKRRPDAQPTRQPSTSAATGSGALRPGHGEDDFRRAGKAALQWLKDSVPWLRKEPQGEEPGRVPEPAAAWAASPLEGGKADPHALAGGVGGMHLAEGSGTGPLPAGAPVVHGGKAATQMLDPQVNIVREVIDTLRMVIGHPMTWLIVALFVIGSYAMSKFDRRPK
jgi:hypothetical protein